MSDTETPSARDYKDTVFLPVTPFPMKAGLPQKEPAMLAQWQADDMEGQIRAARAGREKFILHDGPPYANGDIHIGHALNHILKDMVVRTQTLKGKDAPYVPGWDCHGLPIEWKVEEQYRKKKLNKDEVPVAEFRAECRAYAQGWVDKQREQLKRLGIGGNWDQPYLTMDFDSEATIVAELLKFAESGQLYRGAKPVMWSPVEKTALAEAEIEYEDITSTQIDVAFEIVDAPNCKFLQQQADWEGAIFAVIWTTTPWTIPVNQALAYGPDVDYVVVHSGGPALLIARDLIGQAGSRGLLDTTKLQIVWDGKGSELAGAIAKHPMHHLGGFFAKPRPFLPGDFVTTETGTGLVHMAPDHGEDDFDLCKASGIEPVFAVEGDGKYRADWAWLGGQGSVINPKFNAPDGPICSDLRDAGGLLAASADYRHSYPHSWRSKAKVIYRCTPQWFIPMDKPLSRREREGAPQARKGEGDAFTAAHPHPGPLPVGEGETLRQTATAAIAATRFVPEKGRNRIGSMVEGRPDWVISRQRAWGVPITLFVERKTGQYLVDAAVNARIIAAMRIEGVDAWRDERAAEYLGLDRDVADFERVTDILDVWFDSGCTHAFVLESGKWPALTRPAGYAGPWADLYLEGSDQHRGWFQSSLMESCGTRGHAPYKAVLTHGFTMDQKGMKMSKSVGNTVDPLKVMETNGADIIRLWALSVDYTEDHRIGDEILKGVADQYRKLRNTYRYMLGALAGFEEAERVDVADMPELERYMLHLLADLDAKLAVAVDAFDFNSYVRLLTDFCNEDLSAFFFDIRKDCLYCDVGPAEPLGTLKRRAYRTVLDVMFHAMVRYAAPVLVFTAEEVWGTRFPGEGSVHLLEWPELPVLAPLRHSRAGGNPSPDGEISTGPEMDSGLRRNDEVMERWGRIRAMRTTVNEHIEPFRRDKTIKSSLEAKVKVSAHENDVDYINEVDGAEICIVSELELMSGLVTENAFVVKTTHHKCGRCWRHLPEVTSDGDLCARCETVLGEA